MRKWSPGAKSRALAELADEIFADRNFDSLRTNIGIVSTRWSLETPMIFKTSIEQTHGDRGTFQPGFGCKLSDAVQASCSAYPFFRKKEVITSEGEGVLLVDGGYCANNPTLYAIADAVRALRAPLDHIRVVSIGVGEYPQPKRYFRLSYWLGYLLTVRLLQKILEINTKSMEQLRTVLFSEIKGVRVSNSYVEPTLATDLFESDLTKLDQLYQRGRDSFRQFERQIKDNLGVP
jgi:patatin-like phospholipase/acyl hydrolase